MKISILKSFIVQRLMLMASDNVLFVFHSWLEGIYIKNSFENKSKKIKQKRF